MVPVSAILLDVDGTLIDSNFAHAKAWQDAFREANYDPDFDLILQKIGKGGDHLLPEVVDLAPESAKAKQIDKRRGEIFKSVYLKTLHAFPGAEELLKLLKAKSYRLVIATSASKSDLHAILKQGGIDGIVHDETTATDADRSKPDPDIIHAALALGHHHPDATVMIGDTPYDIEAAQKAGVRTVALCSGGWSEEKLKSAGAWKVYPSPLALLGSIKSGHSPF